MIISYSYKVYKPKSTGVPLRKNTFYGRTAKFDLLKVLSFTTNTSFAIFGANYEKLAKTIVVY